MKNEKIGCCEGRLLKVDYTGSTDASDMIAECGLNGLFVEP